MGRKNSSSKVVTIAVSLAIVLSFVVIANPSRVNAQAGMDPNDLLSIPIKNFTAAAEKFARVGLSVGGTPIPFTSYDYFMKLAVKQIINKLNNSILSWINTGNNGEPMFVTDLSAYMNQVKNTAGSQYLADNQGNFCGYFSGDLSTALSIKFQVDGTGGGGGGTCDFENKGYDINALSNGNFEQGGGWNAWISLTQNDNNNPMGAWLKQKDAMATKISEEQAKAREEADWGNGTMSEKDSSGKITTPGKAISDQMSFVLTSDQRQLELAKNFDDVITTLANSLMSKVMNGVSGAVNGAGGGDSGGVSALNQSNLRDTSNQHLAFPVGNQTNTTSVGFKNVAQTSTAIGTTHIGFHDPSLALVPNNSGCSQDYCGYISGLRDNPYWEVDLGDVVPINKITVSPLNGDYPLNNIYVCIFSTKETAAKPHACNATTAINSTQWRSAKFVAPLDDQGNPTQISTITIASTDMPAGISGQYVRVQRAQNSSRLALRNVQVFAKSVPTIYLAGEKTITTPVNNVFNDPGYTAVDENEGDVTNRVKVVWSQVLNGVSTPMTSNNSATSTPGTYTITYTVRNAAGVSNSVGLTKPVTRTVIVQ